MASFLQKNYIKILKYKTQLRKTPLGFKPLVYDKISIQNIDPNLKKSIGVIVYPLSPRSY